MDTLAGIAFLDRLELEHLIERLRTDGPQFETEIPIHEQLGQEIRGKIALLVYDDAAMFIARLVRGKAAGRTRRNFQVQMVTPVVPPLPIVQIRAGLLASQRDATYDPGGSLTAKATHRALETLLRERPNLGSIIDDIAASGPRITRPDLIPLVEQRDAVATLLDIAGFKPERRFIDDRSWLDEGRVTFLPEVTTAAALEDPMIEHDGNIFLGWSPRRTDRLGVRTFTNGYGKDLHVMNVNRWGIETAVGADLLYYHVQRRSFALVQYKRMAFESGRWLYRPDKHFIEQQERMKALDEACKNLGLHEYRLTPAPSFLKICRLESLHVDNLSMISGMYLASKQAEMHLADESARGPRGGQFFSHENVKSYMTVSLFTNLVAHGLLGTTGASTDLVLRILDASLNQRGAAVLGILDDARGRRPGWKEQVTAI